MGTEVSLVFRAPSTQMQFWIHGCEALHQHRKDFAVNRPTHTVLQRVFFNSIHILERAVFLEKWKKTI